VGFEIILTGAGDPVEVRLFAKELGSMSIAHEDRVGGRVEGVHRQLTKKPQQLATEITSDRNVAIQTVARERNNTMREGEGQFAPKQGSDKGGKEGGEVLL